MTALDPPRLTPDQQRQLAQLQAEYQAVSRALEAENNPRTREQLRAQLRHIEEEIARVRAGLPPPLAEPSFLVPFLQNQAFVGRQEDLEQLHQALSREGPVGLTGLGGIGKTELAVEYCYHYRDAYPGGVFWVNAAELWSQGFAELGRSLQPALAAATQDEQIRAVADHLRAHPDSLLVLDNVADPALLRRPVTLDLTPAGLGCRVLFTTRRRDLGDFQPIEVSVLPEEPGLRLLLRRPERQAVLQAEHPEHADARATYRLLGGLPLALEIAGAFLGEWPEVSLADFRARLRQDGVLATVDEEAEELPEASLRGIHQAAVAATLEEQWQGLNTRRRADQDARLLLRIAGQLPEAAQIPAAQLGLLAGMEDGGKPGRPPRLRRALRRLEALSLVEELRMDSVQLHPLVREFATNQIPDSEREALVRAWAHNALNALEASSGEPETTQDVAASLLAVGWDHLGDAVHGRAYELLAALMTDDRATGTGQRAAAFALRDLQWLRHSDGAPVELLLSYMRQVGRYVRSSQERLVLVERLSPVVEGDATTSSRQAAELLVFRAAMLAQLRELEQAQKDYQRALDAIDPLLVPAAPDPEDLRIRIRASLGAANVTAELAERIATTCTESERSLDPQEHLTRQDLLSRAIGLYLKAEHSAQALVHDPILLVTIKKELCYTYALQRRWPEAARVYVEAQSALQQSNLEASDPDAYHVYVARLLHTGGEAHALRGRCLTSELHRLAASDAFRQAYELVQQEIEHLEAMDLESDDLAIAYINSADYLLEQVTCSDVDPSGAFLEVERSLQHALKMAQRLRYPYLEEAAQELLARLAASQGAAAPSGQEEDTQ